MSARALLACLLSCACSSGALEYAGSDYQIAPELLPAGAPDHGIYLYWPLDSDSLAFSADASGHGRDGTYAGSPSLSEPAPNGRPGNARGVFLGGVDQSLSYASDSALAAFSVGVWLKPASTASQALFSVLDATGNALLAVELDEQGRFRLRASPVACAGSALCPTSGEAVLVDHWYYVSAVIDGTRSARLFSNGTEQGSGSVPGAMVGAARYVFGAGSAASPAFRGVIDEAVMYDFPVTPNDIAAPAHAAR